MQFSRTNRRRNALITSTAALTGAGIFLIGFFILALRFFAPGALTTIATPLWQLGDAFGGGYHAVSSLFGNAAELTTARDQLILENQSLSEENRALRAELADVRALADVPQSGVQAGVLARPPVAPYDVLVVGAGTNDGVKVGWRAYGPGGVPLGTVADVTDRSSQVELYSTGGRTEEGWVGEKRIPLTLTGRGAGAFLATLPRESGVVVNDIVYLPGPGALPVGTIARLDTNPSSPRDTLYIAPYVNLFALTRVTLAP